MNDESVCACGYQFPFTYQRAEDAPYESASVVMLCPKCRQRYRCDLPILTEEEFQAGPAKTN